MHIYEEVQRAMYLHSFAKKAMALIVEASICLSAIYSEEMTPTRKSFEVLVPLLPTL